MGEGLKMGQDLLTEDPLKGVKVVIIWWNHWGDIVTGPPDGGQKRNTIAMHQVYHYNMVAFSAMAVSMLSRLSDCLMV
ncbi:hypothetical protein PROFUN_13673 [Planoprotostelium fungivorum]|uniref:Uncharacterized protein n=1 Tax=Planoprotostelium fungivorum TaxID=1890364 RepID=A0A2P6MN23_9EUKA|nr:hypothetical protein PROFUN_13673 [Planoprotostelium fungivorum]